MRDFSLYLVTHQKSLSLEDFFRIILEAVEGGVTIVQLREKERSTKEICDVGKKLLSLLKPLGVPLLINDRVDIAHAIKADGVHLGQSDLNVSEARAILGKEVIVGLSVETLEEVEEAKDVDYLAVSPLFATKTKEDTATPWGLAGLKKASSLSRYPVIAIGGIDASNIEDVFTNGAKGAAVVSAIFQAPCPKTAATILKRKCPCTSVS